MVALLHGNCVDSLIKAPAMQAVRKQAAEPKQKDFDKK